MWTYQDKLLKEFSIKLIYFCDCAFSLIHLIIFIPYTCANEISVQKPTSVPGPSPTRSPEQERKQAGLFILPLLDSFGKGTEHLNMELYELNVNKGNFNFFPLEVINCGKTVTVQTHD